MKTYLRLMAWSALLALAACGVPPGPASGTPPSRHLELDATGSFVRQQLIVGYEPSHAPEDIAAAVGATLRTDWPEIRAALLVLPDGLGVTKAQRLLRRIPGVAYSEPNRVIELEPDHEASPAAASIQPLASIGDPEFNKQWQHRQLNTPAAWDLGATGRGIRIGIHDQFMDLHHPDLAPNVFYPGWDGFTGSLITEGTPYVPLDEGNDHGTYVAGTAAAAGNDIGGRGTAFEASIVPLSISEPNTGALVTDAIISSAIFAVVGPDGVSPLENPGGDSDSAPGAQAYVHIVNMSWGGVAYDQAVNDAMDYMLAHGIVLVTSAGNTPTTGYTEPAWHPGILSVAATRPTGERSAFSNRGRHLSVAAPGVNIWTTATRSCVQQTPDRSSCDPAHPDVNYAYVSGTSFSSPATAGVAALLLDASATRDSDGKITAINLSPAQVRQILEETATQPAGYDPLDLGHGIVDAEAAVKMAMDASQRPPEGATLVVDAVLASDTSVRLPTVSLSLVPNDGGATLYTQTADGSFAALGQGLFQEIDPGDYTLLASGPHTVTTGIEAATFQTDVHLAPGQVATIQAPLDVALFKDPDEPNEDIATAKPLAAGTTQRASLFHPAAASDIDVYRLDVAGGSDYWINVDAVTGDQDMLLEVLADDGTVLASNDDNRETPVGEALPDPALVFSPEADASVYLRLTAKNGDNNPLDLYELDVSELVGAESEPNGSGDNTAGSITNADFTDAESLAVGQALTGAVDPATDVDFVATALEAGTTYVVDLETAVNLEPDTVLVVLASDGSVLASNDDYDAQDSRLAFTVESAGTYYLGVTDFFDPTSQQASTGPYTLSVTTHNNPGAP